MKNRKLTGFLSLVAVAVFGFSSCQEEPKEHDAVLGNYKGTITYADTKNPTASTVIKEGTLAIRKTGKAYSFDFPGNIPDISSIQFDKKGDVYTAVGLDVRNRITIENGKLNLLYIEGALDKTWGAQCQKQ